MNTILEKQLLRWAANQPVDADLDSADDTAQRILDAALAQFRLLGLRRSSMDTIARRAGLGRVTIYRRFSNKEALVEAVLVREIQRSLNAIRSALEPLQSVEEAIECGLVMGLKIAREDALIAQLMAVEPEDVVMLLTVHAGPILALGSRFVASLIAKAQHDQLIDPYPPQPVAELVARLAHSLLLTPSGGLPLADDVQVRAFARSTIVPLLMHGTPCHSATQA